MFSNIEYILKNTEFNFDLKRQIVFENAHASASKWQVSGWQGKEDRGFFISSFVFNNWD